MQASINFLYGQVPKVLCENSWCIQDCSQQAYKQLVESNNNISNDVTTSEYRQVVNISTKMNKKHTTVFRNRSNKFFHVFRTIKNVEYEKLLFNSIIFYPTLSLFWAISLRKRRNNIFSANTSPYSCEISRFSANCEQ